MYSFPGLENLRNSKKIDKSNEPLGAQQKLALSIESGCNVCFRWVHVGCSILVATFNGKSWLPDPKVFLMLLSPMPGVYTVWESVGVLCLAPRGSVGTFFAFIAWCGSQGNVPIVVGLSEYHTWAYNWDWKIGKQAWSRNWFVPPCMRLWCIWFTLWRFHVAADSEKGTLAKT